MVSSRETYCSVMRAWNNDNDPVKQHEQDTIGYDDHPVSCRDTRWYGKAMYESNS